METDLSKLPRGRVLWLLFFNFFKIALFVVGGGYAIILAAEDIFIRKLHWLRDGELSDMLALIQVVPGLTAGNVAIYAGFRVAGFPGAFAALTGVATPSFLVISFVAMGFDLIPIGHPLLAGAFAGVRTAMTALTFVAMLRIWRGSVGAPVQKALFFACLLLILVGHINPGWLIGGGLLFGVIYCMLICRKMPPGSEPGEGEAK